MRASSSSLFPADNQGYVQSIPLKGLVDAPICFAFTVALSHFRLVRLTEVSCRWFRIIPLLIACLVPSNGLSANLDFSTYLGGQGNDGAVAVISGTDGAIYVLGSTRSGAWMTNNSTVMASIPRPEQGIFVMKLHGSSHVPIYKTVVAGDAEETPVGLAVDGSGRVVVVGTTSSAQFPGVGAVSKPGKNLFVFRLNAAGNSLDYSRVLGGSGDDIATCMAVDAKAGVVIAGTTNSPDFPPDNSGGRLFVIRVMGENGALSVLQSFGESNGESITSVAVGQNSEIFFAGFTDSPKFPATLGQPVGGGKTSGFVGRIPAEGGIRQLRAFGGEHQTASLAVAIRGLEVIVAGRTDGAFGLSSGDSDGFVAIFSGDLTVLNHSLVLGGSGFDEVTGVANHSGGSILVTGRTGSGDLPQMEAVQPRYGGGQFDGFIGAVRAETGQIQYMSYLGGSGLDSGISLTSGNQGAIILVGRVFSGPELPQFPTSAGALQPQFGGGSRDAFMTQISLEQRVPTNDSFAGKLRLFGASITTTANSLLASREIDEPLHAGKSAGHTLWWSWTAPRSGWVIMNTVGSSFDTVLAVYVNETVSALREIASNDDTDGHSTSRVAFQAEAGVSYHIAVGGSGDGKGSAILNVTMDLPPNDDFAHARVLEGFPVFVTASNTNATVELNEPSLFNDPYLGRNSVWFKWKAPMSGKVRVDASTSLFRGGLTAGVFTGEKLSSLKLLVSNNNNFLSSFVFNAVRDSIYYVLVDGLKPYPYEDRDAFGLISLSLSPASSPSNDDFNDRIDLTSAPMPVRVTGTLTDASAEPGEVGRNWQLADRTVWWTWTPARDGVFTFKTRGMLDNSTSLFLPITALEVLKGSQTTSLTSLGINYREFTEAPRFSSSLTLELKAGLPVQIRVDAYYYSIPSGAFTLDIQQENQPLNDHFAGAMPISGPAMRLVGTTRGATREALEPRDESYGATLWWKWTAPSTGTVVLDGTDSPLHKSIHKLTLDVWTGTSSDDLRMVSRNYDWPFGGEDCFYICYDSIATFRVSKGESYFIRVGGYSGAIGEFDVGLKLISTPPNDHFVESTLLGSNESLTVIGNNLGATREYESALGFEPNHMAQVFGFQSVWWKWVAPINGNVVLNLGENLGNNILAVYVVDENGGSRRRIANNQPVPDSIKLIAKTSFWGLQGKEYFIALDSLGGLGGPFRFSLEQAPALQLQIERQLDRPRYRLQARGDSTNLFVVLTSVNLKIWTILSTNVLVGGRAAILNLEAMDEPVRFYRAEEIRD